MKTDTVRKLIFARAMYIHYKQNHSQAKKLQLEYWGNQCLKIRKELEK